LITYPRRFFGMSSRHAAVRSASLCYAFNMLIQCAYKFRFYPMATQRKQLAVEFGNAHFAWNRCLNLRSQAWEADKTRHHYASLSRQVTDWKRGEFPWLADSTAGYLVQKLLGQNKVFKNFFGKHGQYPKLSGARPVGSTPD
jgi:putative transposase